MVIWNCPNTLKDEFPVILKPAGFVIDLFVAVYHSPSLPEYSKDMRVKYAVVEDLKFGKLPDVVYASLSVVVDLLDSILAWGGCNLAFSELEAEHIRQIAFEIMDNRWINLDDSFRSNVSRSRKHNR